MLKPYARSNIEGLLSQISFKTEGKRKKEKGKDKSKDKSKR